MQVTDTNLFEQSNVISAPYPVPSTCVPGVARQKHREFYWVCMDKESYQCPDCGRECDDVNRFEVHHIDGNPLNGLPENLIALCKRCHLWRHGDEQNLSAYTLNEWKSAFLSIGD